MNIFILKLRQLWPLLLGAFVLAGTACEALATQGAREAVETGREVRNLEDSEVRPLEDELRALIRDEIEPLQDELEDLFFEEREIQNNVLRPLWESQEDPWSPGGELFVAQQGFEGRFQDIERRYRVIELEERELQNSFNNGYDPYNSPETQAVEDQRYELQRELDRLYRRGWDPVNEIYDQINYLSQGFNWSDPGTNDRVNEINDQINQLYNEASRIQQDYDGDSSHLWNELDQINNDLNNLYSWGRGPIDDLYRQIEDEQNHLNGSGSISADFSAEIATLESNLVFLESQRDAILSGLYGDQDAVGAELSGLLAAYDSDIAALESELSDLSASTGTVTTTLDPTVEAELEALEAELQAELAAINAIEDAADADIGALIADEDAAVAPIKDEIDSLVLQIADIDDGTASTTDAVAALEADHAALEAELGEIYSETDSAIGLIEADRDAAIAPHEANVNELESTIDDLSALLITTSAVTVSDDNSAQIDLLENQLSDLRLQRDAEAASYYEKLDQISLAIDTEASFWGSQIDGVRFEIDSLDSQNNGDSGSFDDSFLQSLYSQAAEMEDDYQSKIDALEGRRSDLEVQANNLSFEDPAQHIYEKIDELNGILYQLADQSGTVAAGNQRQMDELQRKAFEMEQELQGKTRLLEDRLWDLDDELQDYYRELELSQRGVHNDSGAAFNGLQARRFALDDERFLIENEMNEFFNGFDGGRHEIEAEAKRLEGELLVPIRVRIREIEIQLKDLRIEARTLERQIRSAEDFVDDRRRELEDDVFNLLEGALSAGEALLEEGLANENGLLGGDITADGVVTDDDVSLLDGIGNSVPADEDGSSLVDPTMGDGTTVDPVAVE